ncbi:MAG: RidA family protein [Rhizobiaceae bacterium]|nr:RidA family protein [Rhizobiaceae bacterium]
MPKPFPLSTCREASGLVFFSGQVPLNNGELIGDDFAEQARQAFQNLAHALWEVGLHETDVIKCNCYLRNASDMPRFNEIYEGFFGAPFPARTTILAEFPNPAFLIEIEAIAQRG